MLSSAGRKQGLGPTTAATATAAVTLKGAIRTAFGLAAGVAVCVCVSTPFSKVLPGNFYRRFH